MRKITVILSTLLGLLLSGCTVLGKPGVEITPYTVLKKDEAYELRYYESLMLVSTPMSSEEDQDSAFKKLFNYISGYNQSAKKIAMTGIK